MSMRNRNILILVLVVLVAVVVIGLTLVLKGPQRGETGGTGVEESQDWMLSLYQSGITLLRLDYDSLEACLSAGNSYKADQSIDRFDCGLNCENSVDLSQAILCKQVCNPGGCR